MITEITIKLNVSDQFLRDVLCTACEGGSNYWAAMKAMKTHKGESGLEWETARVAEWEASGDKKQTFSIGLVELREGVRRVIAGDMTSKESHANCHVSNSGNLLCAIRLDDAGQVDCDLADLVLQAACFGHIVYG